MATRKTTTSKTTTTRKSTSTRTTKPKTTSTTARTTKTTAAKTAPVKPATPVVVAASAPSSIGPELKKKELVEKVVKLSGVKKRDVKPTVEAMLEVLGEAIREGRELNLAPMGKAKVNRAMQKSGHRVSVLKVRQKTKTATAADDAGDEPLAPAAE